MNTPEPKVRDVVEFTVGVKSDRGQIIAITPQRQVSWAYIAVLGQNYLQPVPIDQLTIVQTSLESFDGGDWSFNILTDTVRIGDREFVPADKVERCLAAIRNHDEGQKIGADLRELVDAVGDDSGPAGESWKSDELLTLIGRVERYATLIAGAP